MPSPTKNPNVLFVMADVGGFKVSAFTAGYAAFITGHSPIRTGSTKAGPPGANLGLMPRAG